MNPMVKWVGISFAIIILIVLSLPFLINVDQFRPTLQSDLTTALGREVTLGNPDRLRRILQSSESVVIPAGALLASGVVFGLFCAVAGANPFGVFASIYKAGFGSWYSLQNTLLRAAPLMLTADWAD